MTAAKTIGRHMARRLDQREPILDARLPDKSRVNIIIDPCYHQGACIAIGKFPSEQFSWQDVRRFGSIDTAGVAIVESLVRLGKNTLISGGTGSGKTTLLNCLCSFIQSSDIVVTVEDAREISLSNELWVALEAKRALDAEDRDVTLRVLVRTSLRMNPRWIIVGEVRGPDDRLAVVIKQSSGQVIQRISTAERIASPDFQRSGYVSRISAEATSTFRQTPFADRPQPGLGANLPQSVMSSWTSTSMERRFFRQFSMIRTSLSPVMS